jgi:hypothetical protein
MMYVVASSCPARTLRRLSFFYGRFYSWVLPALTTS